MEERAVDARAVLHHLPALLALLLDLLQVRGDDAPGLRAVAGIGPLLGEVDLHLARAQRALEVVAAPLGAVVEFEPALDGPVLGRVLVVREDAGMGDRVARPEERMIGALARRIEG